MAVIGDCACLYKSISELISHALVEEVTRSSSLKGILKKRKVSTTEIDSYIDNLDEVRQLVAQTPICKKEPTKISAMPIADLAKKLGQVKSTEELLELVKGHPELEKAMLTAQEGRSPSKETPVERSLPALWGPATFQGTGKEAKLTGEYDSPGALAKALNIKTRGAQTMIVAFRRAGFEVRGNGEDIEKGTTKFIVKRVGSTERKWRAGIPIIFPEATRGPAGELSEAERPTG